MATAKTEPLMAYVINAVTAVETIRELTADELAQRKLDEAQTKANESEATALTDARISALAKLAKLGLTEAEIASL